MATTLTILWWDQITGNPVTINLLNITGIDNIYLFLGSLKTLGFLKIFYVLNQRVIIEGEC